MDEGAATNDPSVTSRGALRVDLVRGGVPRRIPICHPLLDIASQLENPLCATAIIQFVDRSKFDKAVTVVMRPPAAAAVVCE